MQNPEKVQAAADHLRKWLAAPPRNPAAAVLGTGLGDLADALGPSRAIDYADIPGFPTSTVPGHHGRLIVCETPARTVFLLQGRFHLYEGYSPADVCLGVRVLAGLGARTLAVTNAAGALNPLFEAGGLMVITDHVNLTGQNPLVGPNHDAWGPRFPDMSRVYCERLRRLALAKGLALGLRLEQGVYAGLLGPSLESPAETRALRVLGADAVGMSTVMEVIAARHLGLEVLGLSCLTNKNLPDCMAETSLEEILERARQSSHDLMRLLAAILPEA